MIGSVLKIDFRHFWRNRFSFLVSISGLCVGIISVVLILLFLEHEITYDQFFPRYPDLYRISRIITYKGEVTNIALTDGKLETILEENVPEIQNATKFIKVQNDLLFKKDTESYVENNGLICDVDFLQVLTFKLHSGDEFEALSKPNSIVLTKRMAERYFGSIEVIGRSLVVKDNGQEIHMQITAILENLPTNSVFNFDFLISGSSFQYWEMAINGGAAPFHTFFISQPNAPQNLLIERIQSNQVLTNTGDADLKVDYSIQQVTSLHFNAGKLFDLFQKVDDTYINILIGLMLFLSVVTAFNFSSMLASNSIARLKEIGIKKMLGVKNYQLIVHVLMSATINCLGVISISVVTAYFFMEHWMNNWLGTDINIFNSSYVFWWIAIFFIASIALATAYPAAIIFKNNAINSLKSRVSLNQDTLYSARSLMMILQFSLTIGFVGWSFLIQRQLNHLNNLDPGFNPSGVICLSRSVGTEPSKWLKFQQDLKANSSIEAVSVSRYELIGKLNSSVLETGDREPLKVYWNQVDHNFIPTLGMEIVKGRNFSEEIIADSNAIIINETAWKALGSNDNILNNKWTFPVIRENETVVVIGVVKDFHFESFSNEIPPVVISLDANFSRHLYVKATIGSNDQIIKQISSLWNKNNMDAPLQYKYLEDSFKSLISTETKLGNISYTFTIISLAISLFTLLASVTLYLRRSVKVFAIKRIMGAEVTNMINDINRIYIKRLFVAAVIAIPAGWLVIVYWLNSFKYKVSGGLQDLLQSILIISVMSIVMISMVVYKYSTKLTSASLKDE